MKIEITVFKNSGKYYTSEIAKSDNDIPIYDDNFKKFIRDNIPANLGSGFIMTNDVENNQSFHIALWRYDEVFCNTFLIG